MKISRRQFLLNSTALVGAWAILGGPYKYATGGVISPAASRGATLGAYRPGRAREYFRPQGMRDWKITVNLKFNKP